MKKIMILGAGIYQVPLIKKAKEMGLYTIVVSVEGDYPGFEFADKIYYLNTKDIDGILNSAKEEEIDGICTTGTDVAVPAIGKVCDEMKLSGVSYESAVKASDKYEMKKSFMEQGVKTAKYVTVRSFDEAMAVVDTLQFPIIFKAVDTSGSRGIVRVDEKTQEAFEKAIENVKKYTEKDYFVIEEFIEGEEFGAQALISNGEVKFVMPHGDYVFMGDTGVPVGHFVPYQISPEVLEESKRQVRLSTQALKLDNCAINADFIKRGEDIYVLEIGARAGATCLTEMVSQYYGVDYYKMLIQTALGEELPVLKEQHLTPNACKLLMSERSGTIKSISLPEKQDDRLIDLSVDYGCGDHVNKFRIGPDRIGQIITIGETLDEAVQLLDDMYEKVIIEVEE